nr:hypothetical protein [Tanacetum cinerariifolium]
MLHLFLSYVLNKVNHQNQFVPQAVLLRTGKVNILPARPQPFPTGKPKVFVPIPTGRPNRPFPVSTDRGYSPSVSSGWWKSTARPMPHFSSLTRVFHSPMLHLLRVEMVINSPWIMPIIGTKELASPEQTASGLASPRVSSYLVKAYQIYSYCCRSTHVAAMVLKHVAGLRFAKDSSMLLPFAVQCCWYVVPTGRVIVPTSRVIVATGRSTHVAAMVLKHVAGLRFAKDSSMLLPFAVQCCWYVVPTGRVIVPTSRVIVATGRYVVPTG